MKVKEGQIKLIKENSCNHLLFLVQIEINVMCSGLAKFLQRDFKYLTLLNKLKNNFSAYQVDLLYKQNTFVITYGTKLGQSRP